MFTAPGHMPPLDAAYIDISMGTTITLMSARPVELVGQFTRMFVGAGAFPLFRRRLAPRELHAARRRGLFISR
jgi:hypothetical protein